MPSVTLKPTDLYATGPVVEVAVTLAPAVVRLAIENNQKVPRYLTKALIDTGATNSCILPSIAERLGVTSHMQTTIQHAAGAKIVNVYNLGITMPITGGAIIPIRASEFNSGSHRFEVLLGRDVLSRCTLFYNGPDDSFVLQF